MKIYFWRVNNENENFRVFVYITVFTFTSFYETVINIMFSNQNLRKHSQ